MSIQENSSSENQIIEQKISDKELNFRALQAKYERQLAEERQAREIAERKLQEKEQVSYEEDESEPYVDNKRLEKKLARFGEQTKQHTQSEIQNAIQKALYEEKKQQYLRQNPDFYSVIQQNADKLYQKDSELADTILEMPDNFERQKLVYKNIKALGLDKPEMKQSSVQDKIDANKRSPYYQPSGVANAPYAAQSDFSPSGQKQAYQKMKELQARLRF